ncbi:hypothetical protein [Bacillus tuaregi]|uniref:hypothetical protein n=1 Tax=Bacillus tuaregi TaxID=1816695 RepID=UPI0008F86E52|nr:hypothetical protein [Bacillus tuaregi]
MEEYLPGNYISREVKQIINEVGDEIECEIIRYKNRYAVTVTICQDEPPFLDCIGFGEDPRRKKKALKKALKHLYIQAYGK